MSLTKWFGERWVDLGRPKKGGGYEDCGRSDASKGAYPKCVPAARAASMTSSEVRSALRRKREAERDTRRVGLSQSSAPSWAASFSSFSVAS